MPMASSRVQRRWVLFSATVALAMAKTSELYDSSEHWDIKGLDGAAGAARRSLRRREEQPERRELMAVGAPALTARERLELAIGKSWQPTRQMPEFYAWTVCPELRLAYVHVYKSGGSTARVNLYETCARAGGQAAFYSHFANNNHPIPLPNEIYMPSGSPVGYTLYTFVREPIGRFFSSYHEVRIREARSAVGLPPAAILGYPHSETEHKQFVKNFNAKPFTEEDRRRDIDRCIESLLTGRGDDATNPHFMPQPYFTQRPDGSLLPLTVFPMAEMAGALSTLYAGVRYGPGNAGGSGIGGYGSGYGRLEQDMAAAAGASTLAGRSKDRKDADYSVPRFMISTPDLTADNLHALCLHYFIDFCYFGMDPNGSPATETAPAMEASPCAPHAAEIAARCSQRNVAWNTMPRVRPDAAMAAAMAAVAADNVAAAEAAVLAQAAATGRESSSDTEGETARITVDRRNGW